MGAALRMAFLDACPTEVRGSAESLPELSELLETLADRARQAWPELPFEAASFARFVGERATAAVLEQGIETLHVEDLHLVQRCASGDDRALGLFDKRMLAPAVRAYADDELHSRVREKLFTGAKPKISDYAGRGSLLAWLSMIVKREAIDLSRASKKKAEEAKPSLADVLASDPELKPARDEAKEALSDALNAAIAELPVAERRMLRMFHLDGMPHGQIGTALGMPRSTVAHRLGKARADLLQRVRSHLVGKLRLRPSEVDSLIGLARSHLDLSLSMLRID